MKTTVRVVLMAFCTSGLLITAGAAQTAAAPPAARAGAPRPAASPGFEVTGRYTAQRRPRVTVLDILDTVQKEEKTLYGASVEAMLVTFLKRKSQFVVVERQKSALDRLYAEKKRLQFGEVEINPDDKESQELLEKVDAYVLGSITLLDHSLPLEPKDSEEVDAESDEDSNQGEDFGRSRDEKKRLRKLDSVPGQRIEIDLKLISRFDGRIVAAAQRSGPLACLRSIVERLGVALEQEFLRPYYGKLAVTLDEPEHIRVFLTPILPDDALDEEKPPVERSATVTIGGDYDTVELWTTDPTTYTIKNILSGWYSMRIERPGYESIGLDNARWEVRRRQGKEMVYDRVAGGPIEKSDPDDSRFVVRVDPLTTEVVDGHVRGFRFQKQGGSLSPLVRRQYLDTDFSRPPQRVLLMGSADIEINQLQSPAEYADDARCDLFEELPPRPINYGRTYVTKGQSFDFSSFKGGDLIIEDYQGEEVPVGTYQMVLWEPSYRVERSDVRVRAGDDKKQIKTSLTREVGGLSLTATGTSPTSQVSLVGQETGLRIELPLDFEKSKEIRALPVDHYLTTTNVAGLEGWQRNTIVRGQNTVPPKFDMKSARNKPALVKSPRSDEDILVRAGVKTRFGIAGRLETLSQRPDPLTGEVYIDSVFPFILNRLLYGVTRRPEEGRSDFTTASAEAGRTPPTTVDKVSLEVKKEATEEEKKEKEEKQKEEKKEGSEGPRNQEDREIQAAVEGAEPLQDLSIDLGGPYVLEERTPLTPEQVLEDPKILRRLLAERLEYLDLVVLDPVDMVQLRREPEVAGILARYVASGGSLFAYVSAVGDYRQIIGVPLSIEKLSRRKTRRLDLAPGEVEGLIAKLARREVKVKAKRSLPEVADLSSTPWRTLAYTRKGRRPRIIERGGQEQGGYVTLWLDDPLAFRGRRGGTRPKVEEARGRVEAHVMQQARNLMRRRFDRSLLTLQPCAPATTGN